jgi:protein-tyrosine phosphatase
MSDVRDWRRLEERRSTLHDAAQALANGRLVAFMLETGYAVAACGLLPAAVEQLVDVPDRESCGPAALLLNSACAMADWAPHLSAAAIRLSRRCWPGPVQFVLKTGSDGGIASRLDPDVRRVACRDGDLHLRVPAHEAIRQTSRLLPGFLVLAETTIGAGQNSSAAESLDVRYGDRLAMIVEDGPQPYDRPASIVRLHENGWELVREGALTALALQELSARMIVFVCTGNTCRSPLAEALCKKLLAERCNCAVEELPRRGFVALSAGLSAAPGCRAAPEAIAIAREHGVDLEGHATRLVTAALLRQADHVFAMTASHLRAIAMHLPGASGWIQLLSPRGDDISDPIGGDGATYKECAEQILQCLTERLAAISGQ